MSTRLDLSGVSGCPSQTLAKVRLGKSESVSPAGWNLGVFLLLGVVVAATRVPYVSDHQMMSKDGPHYVTSLELGPDYSVPMPGNLGYVLLAKAMQSIWADPIVAFAVVNGALTCLGSLYVYRLGVLWLSPLTAAATALAVALNPVVWWYGSTINSYLVWLAVLPAIGYHGVRFRERGWRLDLLSCSAWLGVGTIMRQDLLVFGTPLWLTCLWLGRASWRELVAGSLVIAACCACWFGGMSAILGGPMPYLERVLAKHEGHMEGFSVLHRGWFEGLLRNASKYALFVLWSAPLVVVPGLLGLLRGLTGGRRDASLIVMAWAIPTLSFSLLVFAGNAGLIFPLLPLLYLGAAGEVKRLMAGERRWLAGATMLGLALAGAVQFVGAPILRETDQRRVILNVTLLRYSGPGLKARLDKNLDDYGIDPALANVMRQLRAPEPLPGPLASAAIAGAWDRADLERGAR